MLGNPASKLLMWRERTTALVVGLAVIVALLMVGLLAPRAQADPSSFTVNTTGDENDLDFPDGVFLRAPRTGCAMWTMLLMGTSAP